MDWNLGQPYKTELCWIPLSLSTIVYCICDSFCSDGEADCMWLVVTQNIRVQDTAAGDSKWLAGTGAITQD